MHQPIFRRAAFAAVAVLALSACAFTLRAAEDDKPAAAGGDDAADPATKPAMVAPDVAQKQIVAPPGFTVSLFAGEPRVKNPAAFHIDEKGRFYVVEANRRRNEVLDIRKLPEWVDDDLNNQTVADRLEMLNRRLTPEQVSRLQGASDSIRRIEDRDGDGKADFDEIFATGFNAVLDGSAAGVLGRVGPTGTDVWFTDIPNLWHLHETPDGTKQDVRESLAYGFGVRYAFSGHDMHGLRFGPDGRLYFSIADRGLHVEKDGKTIVDNPNSGAVLRCEPDGSNLEIVCTGLRNPQELAFDEHGNLFTGDNNADGGDASRWVYVVEGGDGGWRSAYQQHKYPTKLGPWNADKLWSTQPIALPYSQLPPIANPKISGPSGLTYSPGGPGTPKSLRGKFLLVDFRGGPAGGSGVYALRNLPKGAAFELAEMTPFVTGVLATDVDYGYDGAVYFTDWVNGWEPKGQGRIWRVGEAEATKAAAETQKLVSEGIWRLPPERLLPLLSHDDQRVRQAAQFALAEKGDASVVAAFTWIAMKDPHPLARLHAIWGLGQIARKTPATADALVPLLADGDEEVRSQAAKVLGDCHTAAAFDGLVKLLADPSDRVKFFAAMSLGKLGRKEAAPVVIETLRKNADADGYLRHACVMALVGINDPDTLQAASKNPSTSVRMGALLAWRKLKSPQVATLLNDPEPAVVIEAARAINDVPIKEAYPDLAKLTTPLPPPPASTDPKPPARPELALLRAVNAHYRLGGGHSAATLAAIANRSGPSSVRLLALNMLAEWQNPRVRDWICGLPIELPKRDAGPARDALAGVLDKLLHTAPDPVRIAALDAAIALGVTTAPLPEIVADANAPAGLRAAALGAMAKRKDSRLSSMIELAMGQKDPALRLAAIRVLPGVKGGLAQLKPILDTGTPREQQAVLATLAGVKGKETDELLVSAFKRLSAGTLPPEPQLDLLTAAEGRKGEVGKQLSKYNAALPKDDPQAPFHVALAGGDAARGEEIFRDRADVACMRCHAVGAVGGNAGPDLAGLSKRGGREYVLESILTPSKKIALGFESVIVRTKKGDVYAGVLKKEDAESVTIDVPNEGVKTIPVKQIDRRKGGMSAMPEDISKTLSKSDVRDLVEYLSSL